jgi:hypothetical protein
MRIMPRYIVLTFLTAVALLACAFACISSLGLAYKSHLTPRAADGAFEGIAGDGWIEDGATISFPMLLRRGNVAELKIGAWHPDDKPVPVLQASVCGKLVSEFSAVKGGSYTIPLKGRCEPRVLSFKVLNPFLASASDSRLLGPQLESISVSSRVGIPLIEEYSAVFAIFAVLLLGYALAFCFREDAVSLSWFPSWTPVSLLCSAAIAGAFLRNADLQHLERELALWLLITCSAAGYGVFRRTQTLPGFSVTENDLESATKDTGKVFAFVLLLLILGVAAGYRLWGISFGLPSYYHPDEVPKYNAIMRMRAAGDLNPRYFLHPTLLLYTTYFFNQLLRGVGFLTGEWSETLIQAGRYASATAGTLSVALVYAIGSLLYQRRAALVGAAVLAVLPLHITCSRCVKEDALLTFFLLLATWFVVMAVKKNRPWILLLAGAAAGCSASVKYSGMLACMVLVGAPWLKSASWWPDRRYLKWFGVALVVMPVIALAASPYIVLDYQTFLKDFGHETSHMQKGHSGSISSGGVTELGISAVSQLWMYHWGRSIVPGMQWVPALLAAVGLGFAIARRRMTDLYLVALVLLFYLPAEYVRAKPAPQPERYIMPCLPYLALASGLAIVACSRVRSLAGFVPSMIMLAVIVPGMRSARLAEDVSNDTRASMSQWIRENVPAGARIAVDWKPYSVSFPDNAYSMVYLPRADLVGALSTQNLFKGDFDYLVLSSLWYRRHFSEPNANPAIRQHIRNVFRTVPILHEESADSGTYGFHNPRLTLFELNKEKYAKLSEERLLQEQGAIPVTSNEARASFDWSGR